MIRTLSALAAVLLAACGAPGGAPRKQASPRPTSTLGPAAPAPPGRNDPAAMNTSAPLDPPPPPDTEPPRKGPPPFELRLRVTEGPGLELTLHNKSSRAERFLHDINLQPSELRLVSPRGKALEPFDSREIAKYDTTVYDWMFGEVGPGSDVVLHTTQVTSSEGRKELEWGTYEFKKLAPGIYRARAVWRSEVDTYFDDSRARHRLPGVWLGTLESNEVRLRIP